MEKAEEQKMVWAPQVRHNKASWVARSSCTCQKKLEQLYEKRTLFVYKSFCHYHAGRIIDWRDLCETKGGMPALLSGGNCLSNLSQVSFRLSYLTQVA